MQEEEFINHIDCCFPYESEKDWRSLIDIGKSISSNASFMVLHEICRPPVNVQVDGISRLKMLEAWEHANQTTLDKIVAKIARAIIVGHQVSFQEILDSMQKIASFKNEYNALAIVYFSKNDVEELIEKEYERIIKIWES
jgi:hypothetical protein